MTRVITITSGKGGVGKTTTTANLAAALAMMGNRVICIDADIGLRNLDLVMGVENRIRYDLVDVVEKRATLPQAIIKNPSVDELFLLPAAQTRDKTAVSPTQMVTLVNDLKKMNFGYIIIDCPAGIERGFRNAVEPADEVLIVTNPEVSAVRDADRIIGLLEDIGRKNGRQFPMHLIINRVKPDMVRRGDMLSADDIIDILSIELIGVVPDDESVLIASNKGTPQANSPAGQAYRNIARRITGEKVPFMRMDGGGNLLQRLARLFGG